MPQFDNLGLKEGQWRGRLHDLRDRPARVVLVRHAQVLSQARLTADGDNAWLVEVDLPREILTEGLQTLILRTDDGAEGQTEVQPGGLVLARLPVLAGQPLDDDMTAEIAALRAELELLKREFRRFAAGAAAR